MSFTLQNKVRIVTAAALFDGHDAAINIMRRIMQSMILIAASCPSNKAAAVTIRTLF